MSDRDDTRVKLVITSTFSLDEARQCYEELGKEIARAEAAAAEEAATDAVEAAR